MAIVHDLKLLCRRENTGSCNRIQPRSIFIVCSKSHPIIGRKPVVLFIVAIPKNRYVCICILFERTPKNIQQRSTIQSSSPLPLPGEGNSPREQFLKITTCNGRHAGISAEDLANILLSFSSGSCRESGGEDRQ